VKLPEASALVPHRGEALLLEAIDEAGGDGLVASLVVRGQWSFSSGNGSLPAWTGPEIMAQAVSAFATLRKGPPYLPKPGLLLGVRKYRSSLTEFPRGARIAVSVRESTRDEAGSAVFDSLISVDGTPVAEGMLTVFEPADVFEALAEQLA
jgi:predicted hotdog family 3-hydroxylacyl-ACP dehydratase